MTVAIPLLNMPGLVALIDEQDAERVSVHHWYGYQKPRTRTIYVRSSIRQGDRRQEWLLHRFVLNLQRGAGVVDHINRNGLDNRRCNLRVVTHAENVRNSGPRRNRTFKGVYHETRANGYERYRAEIMVDGRKIRLGSFKTAEQAARAWDAAAREHHGLFAYQNLPAVGS